MYVEVVVEGTMGALAVHAFAELVVEQRQIFVASEADAFAALVHLIGQDVSVVVFRQRTDPDVLEESVDPLGGPPS